MRVEKIGVVIIGLVPFNVYGECTPAPDCADLGYTETSCSGSFVRCPFDTSKLFCAPCDSKFQYSCSGDNITGGTGSTCGGKYASCKCVEGATFNNGNCECDSSYQYLCTGTGYSGGSGTACGGKYIECTCSSPYIWSNGSCICSSSYQYSCTGTGYSGGSGTACGGSYTACSCSSGYTWKNGTCIKCDTTCTVGSIYYSDGTCLSCTDSTKTAIGIVVKTNALVMSRVLSTGRTWGGSGTNITNLTDYITADNAKTDYNGKSNTATIVASGVTNSVFDASLCNSYAPSTTNQGDWYLPAVGELYSYLFGNYSAIKSTMSILGWTFTNTYYWSSSEYDSSNAWAVYASSGTIKYWSKATGKGHVCFYEIN